MRGIFISYRRDDAEGQAGRLFDDLTAHFGRDAVFMDVAGIRKGLDFRRIIDAHVASCGVLLVIIGKSWLSAIDSKGQRRLDDANDFVRLETAAALSRDIPVVPVLVHGAEMPTEHDLPDGLKELAYRNGTELTHARWESDVKLLIEDLRPYLDAAAKTAHAPSSAREPSPATESSSSRAIGGGRSHRLLWATGAAVLVVAGAVTLGYRLWPGDGKEDAQPIPMTQVSTVEPERKPVTSTASVVTAKPTPVATVEPKPEPTPAQVAAAKAVAMEAAAARAAAAKAAAARAEAARLEVARLEAARRAADEQFKREEAERAAQRADDQRKRDEEARRLASEQAARDKLAAEQAAGAKMFVDIASAIIGSRQGNRR